MAWEDEQILTLVGFITVLIVGLNMVLAFSDMANLTPSLTGAAVSNEGLACKSTVDGILCEKTLYPKTPATGVCPLGSVPTCTNACALDDVVYNRVRGCSKTCTSVCVPKNLIAKL